MKASHLKFKLIALYTVLIFISPMLPAAEVAQPIQGGQATSQRQLAGAPKEVAHPTQLAPEQLDEVRAGIANFQINNNTFNIDACDLLDIC